jgi:hypothetical protein
MSRKRNWRNSGAPFEFPDISLPHPRTPPPAVGCPLNDAGTLRIIEGVRAKYKPAGLKPDELRDDLLWCFISWLSHAQTSSDKIARKRVQRLEAIAKSADNLRTLLENGEIGGWARQQIAWTFPLNEGAPVRITAEFRTDHGEPDPAPSFNVFLAGLQRLVDAARHKAANSPDVALYRLRRSPFGILVAIELPEVFKRHFEGERKFSRDPAGSKARGPYIRFAVAALRELGITNKGKPYAPETIARAIGDVRKGRVRRRKKKVA